MVKYCKVIRVIAHTQVNIYQVLCFSYPKCDNPEKINQK